MSMMTWEKIRDHHLGKVAYYTDEKYPRAIQRHQAMADFITAHLAQPAQAACVGQPRPLSERLRPTIECAPWVVDEVKKYERMLWGVVANAGRLSATKKVRWSHVSDATAMGSNTSAELCRRFGFSPDEEVGGTEEIDDG